MRLKNEEDVWTSIDNIIDFLEENILIGAKIVDPEEIEKYVKAEMATVYRHLRRVTSRILCVCNGKREISAVVKLFVARDFLLYIRIDADRCHTVRVGKRYCSGCTIFDSAARHQR